MLCQRGELDRAVFWPCRDHRLPDSAPEDSLDFLSDDSTTWLIDLDGIEKALRFAQGPLVQSR